jgi:hypothetical protein
MNCQEIIRCRIQPWIRNSNQSERVFSISIQFHIPKRGLSSKLLDPAIAGKKSQLWMHSLVRRYFALEFVWPKKIIGLKEAWLTIIRYPMISLPFMNGQMLLLNRNSPLFYRLFWENNCHNSMIRQDRYQNTGSDFLTGSEKDGSPPIRIFQSHFIVADV